MSLNKRAIRIFLKAQVASFVSTLVDFSTLIVCTEEFKIYYMFGVVLGATLGAITSFTLGRYWSFKATKDPAQDQALRYFIVALGSLVLNATGVFVLTEFLKLPYIASKIVTSFLVGVVYNFIMQKRFVFRKTRL